MRILLFPLGALLLAVGIIQCVQAAIERVEEPFHGEMRLREDNEERVVTRPSLHPGEAVDSHEDLGYGQGAGADIPFANAQAQSEWIERERLYDFATLPFSLRLVDIRSLGEPKKSDTLAIALPEGTRKVSPSPGTDIMVGDERFKVKCIRAWGGIIREPSGGMALASIATSSDGLTWVENNIIPADQWVRLSPDTVINLRWRQSEEDARAELSKGVPGMESARWGVRDGSAVNWFDSLAPGTGLELADGRSITLVALAEKHETAQGKGPAILCEIRDAQSARQVWVSANTDGPDALILFDYPAGTEWVLMGFTWQEDKVLLVAYHNGEMVSETMAGLGECWSFGGLDIRVDQAMQSAVALAADLSPIREVVLESPKRTVRVRQGESCRLGDAFLTFESTTTDAEVEYVIESRLGKMPPETITIGPNDTVDIARWVVSQGPRAQGRDDVAALYVEQGPSPALRNGLLRSGAGLVLLVAAFVLRTRPRGATGNGPGVPVD